MIKKTYFSETVEAPDPSVLGKALGADDLRIEDVCFFDIECFKVEAPESWCLKRRFRTFMVGIGWWSRHGDFEGVILSGDDEAELLREVNDVFETFRFGCFYATRDWDRRVLEGVWTYVRRGLSPIPGNWPTLNRPNDWWVNLGRIPEFKKVEFPQCDRSDDVWGKEIATMESCDDPRFPRILKHNQSDVIELALRTVAGCEG